MKKLILTLLVIVISAGTAFSQEKRILTLDEVIQLAKENSRSAKLAETRRNRSYWDFRVYKSGLKPQLLLAGNLPNYTNRSIPVTQPDGTVSFRSVNQATADLALRLEQVLPWTNTTVRLETNLVRFEDYEGDVSNFQGDPFGISISQPLFSVNQYKWDKQIKPLEYEQSKRDYVQDLENASRTAAVLFFQLLDQQKNLEIALQNEASSDTVNRIEAGRYNIGTTTEDKLLQTEADLLQAQGDAQQAQLDVQSRSLELRNFIGLTDQVELELVPPSDAPDFHIDFQTALSYAKQNRSEYLNFALRNLNSQQGLAFARSQRFNANISASFGYNSAQTNSIGDIYDPLNTAAGGTLRLNFSIPILDGGRNNARMNQAKESMKFNDFQNEQEQISFEQEISNAVRNFSQIRSKIDIALKRQDIALKRFEITNSRYLAGKVDILDLSNARVSKDASIRGYIGALRQYWDAYYELRTLTLYDFQTRELLYNPLLEYDPKTDSAVIVESK
jgi:outer membrane protein TolC